MPGWGWAAWATGLTLAPTGAGVEESHSLSYHYTATYDAGGLREFWAAGALDGAPIDRYDRATRAKLPAQPWMRDGLEPDYWRQGGLSRAAKEAWFNDAVATLQRRTNRSQGMWSWALNLLASPHQTPYGSNPMSPRPLPCVPLWPNSIPWSPCFPVALTLYLPPAVALTPRLCP